MNNKNNNYRVMKFLEPMNKKDKYKGYVRLDIRGTRGMIIVSVENLGDNKSTSDVYLYKDKKDKIKIGTVNNKKGMIKKNISFGNNCSNIEDYNVCGVVKDDKIVLYSNLFNNVNPNDIRKLEEIIYAESLNEEHENAINMEDTNEKIEDNKEQIVSELEEDEDTDIIETKDTEKYEYENDEVSKIIAEKNNEIQENNEIEENDKVDTAQENNEIEENNEVDTAQENIDIESGKLYENIDEGVESASKKTGYKNKFEENLYKLLCDYNKLEPLSVNIQNLSWWKIPYEDKGVKNGFLPYYNQVISTYYPFPMSNRVTTCQGLIKKYGHYVFGIYKENNCIKRFVYGVPGEFKRDEQPYKGITGFKNWSYKNKDINGVFGYWIAFVDSNTGEVTEPPQIALGK